MKELEVAKVLDWQAFNHGVKVILTDNVARSYRGLDIVDENDPPLPPNTLALFCGTEDSSDGFMILNFNASAGTIAHESWHAVRHLFKSLGVKLDNETVAYHLEHLVRFVTDFQIDTRKKLRRVR